MKRIRRNADENLRALERDFVASPQDEVVAGRYERELRRSRRDGDALEVLIRHLIATGRVRQSVGCLDIEEIASCGTRKSLFGFAKDITAFHLFHMTTCPDCHEATLPLHRMKPFCNRGFLLAVAMRNVGLLPPVQNSFWRLFDAKSARRVVAHASSGKCKTCSVWFRLLPEIMKSGVKANPAHERFVVRSVRQGLNLIRHPAIEENFAKALRWRPRNRIAVLVPCAGTKPFPAAPSHSAGYLPALEGKKVDVWVVSEPLGVVPYAWSERWPNDAYDYPPRFLRGEAWDALSERVAEWLEKLAPKYKKVYAALPGHHERLLRSALEIHNPGNVFDAGHGQCLESGACPPGHGRATSKRYRRYLTGVVRNPIGESAATLATRILADEFDPFSETDEVLIDYDVEPTPVLYNVLARKSGESLGWVAFLGFLRDLFMANVDTFYATDQTSAGAHMIDKAVRLGLIQPLGRSGFAYFAYRLTGDPTDELRRISSVRRNSDEGLSEAESLVKRGHLEAVPALIAGLRRTGKAAPWDALVLWRGTLVGTGEAAPMIEAGKEVQAIAVIEPRPNRAGWDDPRVAVYIPVTGPRGPGWAPVGFGVSGIPDWVTRLVDTPRLLPRPPRRRRNSDERLRRLERAAAAGDHDAQTRLVHERLRAGGITPPSHRLTASPTRSPGWTESMLRAMEMTAWMRIENWLADNVPVNALGDERVELAFAVHVLQDDWRGMSEVWIHDDFDPDRELGSDMPSKGEAVELWEKIIPCHERRVLLAGAWGRLTDQQRYVMIDHFGHWVESALTTLPCVDVQVARNRPRSGS